MPPIIINASGDIRQVASSGTGDVIGPASSTDNAIARFDSTTGKYIQNSGVIVPDAFTGNVVTESDTQTLSNKTIVNLPRVCGGRLTLTSGTPVTTSDVTAAGTLYWTPYLSGDVSLYDTTNSRWLWYTPGEVSGSMSGFTTAQPYDVFLYDNAGTVTMYFLAWASGTARATALTTQNGVKVLSGAGNAKYRYVGTVRMQSTGLCEDSVLRRFVWNYYNRVSRKLLVTDATNSWSDTNTAWHALNSSTANRVEVVIGVSEDVVHLEHWFYSSGTSCYVGIALDATNTNDCDIKLFHVTATSPLCAVFTKPIAEGYHYLQLTVALTSAGTATIVGDNNVPTLQKFGGVGYYAA